MTSPIRGQILSKDMSFKLNSYIDVGAVFAEIEDNSTVSVRIAVPESDISQVQAGGKVGLKLWIYPDIMFSVTVDDIEVSTASEEVDCGRVVYVRSHIENPDGFLISGLTGHAKIADDRTLFVLAFSRALIRFIRVEVWSWIP